MLILIIKYGIKMKFTFIGAAQYAVCGQRKDANRRFGRLQHKKKLPSAGL